MKTCRIWEMSVKYSTANRTLFFFFFRISSFFPSFPIEHWPNEKSILRPRGRRGRSGLSRIRLNFSAPFKDEAAVNPLSVRFKGPVRSQRWNTERGRGPFSLPPSHPSYLALPERSAGSSCTMDELPDTQTSLVSRIYYWILILSALVLHGTSKLLAVIVNRIPPVTLPCRRNALTVFVTQRGMANDHWTTRHTEAGTAALLLRLSWDSWLKTVNPCLAKFDRFGTDRGGARAIQLLLTYANFPNKTNERKIRQVVAPLRETFGSSASEILQARPLGQV